MNRRPAVVYLAPNHWSGARQRTQHLAAGLAASREVLFVEPAAYSLNGAIRGRMRGQSAAPLEPLVTRVSPRLTVFRPSPSVPFSLHHRWLNQIAHRVSFVQLSRQRALTRGSEASSVDVVVGWPPALELARWLRPGRIFYDCMDRFPSFHSGPPRRLMEAYDSQLARLSSAVVVPSRLLERLWQPRTQQVVRIPNGVETARFLPGATPPPEPPELRGLPRPRVGYVGTIGPWLDLELLNLVATSRPGWSLVLIGPIDRDLDGSRLPEKAHYLGPRPYESVPDYLAWLDVLLIPFKLNELTEAVNPIKLYEYCASGKPIAGTPIEEVVAVGDLCHLGRGTVEFQGAVDAAVEEAANPLASRIAARQSLASENSWTRRVKDFEGLLDDPERA